MDASGTRILQSTRAAVWAHLVSAESLAQCIPGCIHAAGTSNEGFEMVVARKLGPVSVKFAGTITLSDVVEAHSVTLTGRGKGGLAGAAGGSARIKLADHPEGCHMSWDLDAQLEGRIARFGTGVVNRAAHTMAEHFVDRLEDMLSA